MKPAKCTNCAAMIPAWKIRNYPSLTVVMVSPEEPVLEAVHFCSFDCKHSFMNETEMA